MKSKSKTQRGGKDAAAHAAQLHKQAIVIDCHSDILMPIAKGYVRLGKQVAIPDPAKWAAPFELPEEPTEWTRWPLGRLYGCMGQYSLPQFLAGGLTSQVCAVFVEDDELDIALRKALEMVYWFHREARENDRFEVVTTAEDIRRLREAGFQAFLVGEHFMRSPSPALALRELLDSFAATPSGEKAP